MVLWSDVLHWDAGELLQIGRRISGASRRTGSLAETLTDAAGALDWDGDAADAARAAILRLHENLRRQAEDLGSVGRCVETVGASLYPLLAVVRDCEDEAAENSMVIDPSGHVVDGLGAYATSSEDAWIAGRERLRILRELSERVGAVVARANDIDDDAVRELSTIASAEPHEPRPGRLLPTPSTAPAHAAFWDTLTQADKTSLLLEHPGDIGNVDGLPANVRDAANRRMLVLERTRLQGVAADLEQRLSENMFGGLFDNADVGLQQTRTRLAALDKIAETLDKGNRQLLVLDNSSGDETLAAIAVGDISAATHVAVFVPGLDSTVETHIGKYDEDMDDLRAATARLLPDGETAACVTWMNYEAPQLGWDLLDPRHTVLSPMAAAVGAPRLTAFLDGIDASRSQDPHLSLLGHSYGSLTAALASKGADTAGVDEMVALGSPGLGVERYDALSVPPDHLFVAETREDFVADLGVFGGDPSENVGARPMATRFGTGLLPSIGHSQYLNDGTVTQHNVALVVAGRSGEVTG
jgi:Alpha/beta hydrolase